MAGRPRSQSVVALRFTITPDDEESKDFHRDLSLSPTSRPRLLPRPRHGRQAHSPLSRTPTSPLCHSPLSPKTRSPVTSPLQRHATSPLPRGATSPISPTSRREMMSPNNRLFTSSPASPRHFRYDMSADDKNLRRRSSLLTVPSVYEVIPDHHHRSHPKQRQRSSSIAGPVRTPDFLRYLNDSGDVDHLGEFPASSTSSMSSDGICADMGLFNQSSQPTKRTPALPGSSECGYNITTTGALQRRRHSNVIDSSSFGMTRLRQFSTTSRGVIVNKGDSMRPRRSISNTSVTSTVSSQSRVPSEPNTPTPADSRNHSPPRSRSRTPSATTPVPLPPPKYRIAMIGSTGVGRNSLVTQFMTSEYMCAYDDSADESGLERSVSVLLDGEEAELIFIRCPDLRTEDPRGSSLSHEEVGLDQETTNQEPIDAWLIVYSVSDRSSFKDVAEALEATWTQEWINTKAVIIVANKTDLERTRTVSTEEGRALAKTYECKFIEVSAGLAHNVDELLVGILAQIRLKKRNLRLVSSTIESENEYFKEGNKESCGKRRRSTIVLGPLTEKLKERGSIKMKGILNKMLGKNAKSKSCENLHML